LGIIVFLKMNLTLQPSVSAEAEIKRTHYQTTIRSANHTIIADEPESVMGTDTGMNPSSLLLASLGSCTAITLRMYIDHKMWVVDEILVKLNLYKTDAGTLIDRKITFEGEINEEQHQKLILIANSCPIHKILTGSMEITTS
jgi:putative redox protein